MAGFSPEKSISDVSSFVRKTRTVRPNRFSSSNTSRHSLNRFDRLGRWSNSGTGRSVTFESSSLDDGLKGRTPNPDPAMSCRRPCAATLGASRRLPRYFASSLLCTAEPTRVSTWFSRGLFVRVTATDGRHNRRPQPGSPGTQPLVAASSRRVAAVTATVATAHAAGQRLLLREYALIRFRTRNPTPTLFGEKFRS